MRLVGGMRGGRPLLVALALLGGTGGCSFGSSGPDAAGRQPLVVDVTMSEYRFDYRPPATAGRVVFRFRNEGTLAHKASMFPLGDDFPPIEDQIRGAERRTVPPFAQIFSRGPGESGIFAVDLQPGVRYAFVCYVLDPDDSTHARKGMSSEFRSASQ